MHLVRIDEVGDWTRRKLEILRYYLSAYATIMGAQTWCRGYHYIDAFAGAGRHLDRETREFLDGSPRVALHISPPFNRLIFVEKDPSRAKALEALQDEYADRQIEVYEGDCNEVLPNQVFPSIGQYERAFLLLDPYNLGIRWNTVQTASQAGRYYDAKKRRYRGTVELMVNFWVSDAVRNVLRPRRELLSPEGLDLLNEIFGNDSWISYVYREDLTLFGSEQVRVEPAIIADRISAAYKARLNEVYAYVSDYDITRNSKNAPMYSLLLASHTDVARRIANDVIKTRGEET